jgi:hypothetical protein
VAFPIYSGFIIAISLAIHLKLWIRRKLISIYLRMRNEEYIIKSAYLAWSSSCRRNHFSLSGWEGGRNSSTQWHILYVLDCICLSSTTNILFESILSQNFMSRYAEDDYYIFTRKFNFDLNTHYRKIETYLFILRNNSKRIE